VTGRTFRRKYVIPYNIKLERICETTYKKRELIILKYFASV
jgi:hypothetical protein